MSLARTNPELTTEHVDTQEDIKYMEEKDETECICKASPYDKCICGKAPNFSMENGKLPDAHYTLCTGCALCEPDR